MFVLKNESFDFHLLIDGRSVGEQQWNVTLHSNGARIKVVSQFGGLLPIQKRIQESDIIMHDGDLWSQYYKESGPDGVYETIFDRCNGIIAINQNNERAEKALVVDHQDPLSLIFLIRSKAGSSGFRAQMVGAQVAVETIDDVSDWSYKIRPGTAYVTIAKDRTLKRLLQPTRFGMLLASREGPQAPKKRVRVST